MGERRSRLWMWGGHRQYTIALPHQLCLNYRVDNSPYRLASSRAFRDSSRLVPVMRIRSTPAAPARERTASRSGGCLGRLLYVPRKFWSMRLTAISLDRKFSGCDLNVIESLTHLRSASRIGGSKWSRGVEREQEAWMWGEDVTLCNGTPNEKSLPKAQTIDPRLKYLSEQAKPAEIYVWRVSGTKIPLIHPSP